MFFSDNHRIEFYDELHSEYEDRYITIGSINGIFTVVTVVYTEREDAIRIISARIANKKEKERYYND